MFDAHRPPCIIVIAERIPSKPPSLMDRWESQQRWTASLPFLAEVQIRGDKYSCQWKLNAYDDDGHKSAFRPLLLELPWARQDLV